MSVCLENESFFHSQDDVGRPGVEACLQKFRLYETRSMFYMIGRDKNRMYWRVLKIDRLDPSELNVREDSTTYTESECSELLRRVHEGNKSTGGLKFVTTCYGIVGFIKFLGPYYMLLITKRREIGVICGHTVYAISKIEMVPVPNSTVRSAVANSRDEDRFKKLLCMVDLTKDFFFSYSYHIMRSLQKNLCDSRTGQVLYETMFVWNEFLTRGIRNHLQNTLWTVALVYGFFKQVLLDHRYHQFFILKFSDPSAKKLPLPIFLIKALTLFHRISFTPSSIGFCVNCLLEVTLSVAGRDLTVTLIARRSRHYAGMRYLKRGVNEEGRVANDVETEQIVFADVPEGFPTQISSVVQNRGSIPLFWSQETSRLNLKPDIILSKKDQNYEATRLHFENLVKRYGNPIIILNLIKTEEKRPRESILRAEFANAINYINKDLPEENHLKFLHWDLHKHSQSKATNALSFLSKVSAYALTLTGFFYCQISSTMRPALCIKWPSSEDVRNSCLGSVNGENESDVVYLRRRHSEGNNIVNGTHFVKPPTFQRGVLRTNCIDCLDRTNAAQYAFGLVALGHQLHALGVIEYPKVDFNTPMAHELMACYERMGDTLAHQYGGSAAHNKIFSAVRGQWKAATQSQEFFRTLQRYYNNAYMDAVKQDAINVFLGNLQPERSKPALQELDSDQHLVGNGEMNDEDDGRSLIKRCLSDGNILRDTSTPLSATLKQENFSGSVPHNHSQGAKVLFGSAPDISNPESEITFSRYTPEIPMRQLFGDVQRESNHIYYTDYGDSSNYSNFVDLDWLSSSGNSCDEEAYERSSLLASSSVAGLSMGDVINGIGANPSTAENGSNVKGGEDALVELSYHSMRHADVLEKCPDSFGKWVTTGEMLCY